VNHADVPTGMCDTVSTTDVKREEFISSSVLGSNAVAARLAHRIYQVVKAISRFFAMGSIAVGSCKNFVEFFAFYIAWIQVDVLFKFGETSCIEDVVHVVATLELS